MHIWCSCGKISSVYAILERDWSQLWENHGYNRDEASSLVKAIQRLTSRIATLNHFISWATDKCLPFFKLIEEDQELQMDRRMSTGFWWVKRYLSSPPLLAKPKPWDELQAYMATSSMALSVVLIWEEAGQQCPTYSVSRMMLGPETKNSYAEQVILALVMVARRLRPYFQAYTIIVITK